MSVIYLATQCFPPDIGGIQSYMFHVADALAREGETVRVFADDSHEPDVASFDEKQIFFVRRFGGFKPLRRRLKAWSIARELRAEPGILICDTWKSLELLPALPASTTILCLAHGMEFPENSSENKVKRIRKAFSRASRVLANSKFTADRLQKFLPDMIPVEIFLPGISTPTMPSQAEREGVRKIISEYGPIVLTIGRLEPRKGQDQVIAALPQLLRSFPKLLFVVIGDGEDLARLQAQADSLSVRQHVLFVGRAVDGVKSAWLEHADIFVMPSRAEGNSVEGFGLVYLEAAWFGLPSIAGITGGAGDAVLANETGLLCDGSDAQAVEKAIAQLLEDEPLRRKLGEAARIRVKKKFMWPTVIESLRQFF